ncbi:MAG TPA: PAS domain-containing sensor histidine kinase, partial [Thermodesulfobacteriota bacterium]
MPISRDATAAVLRDLSDPTADAVALLDASGRIVLVDDRLTELFGYARRELVGLPIDTLIPDLRGRSSRPRRPARAFERSGRRKDGSRLAVRVAFHPLPGDDARLVVCTVCDIARRKSAESALRLLLDASLALGAAEDGDAAALAVARAAVPAMADWCVVDLIASDGTLRRAAVAHADPGLTALARRLRRFTPDPNRPHEAQAALRTGAPQLVPEVTDAWLAAHTRDARHRALLVATGARSLMCVPLATAGRTLGALTFLAAESGRRYEAADLAVALALARQAALAIASAEANLEAREATRLHETVLARAGHELRMPITIIKGHLALLARRLTACGADEQLQGLLAVARRHTDRMAELLSDLIETSRLSAGRAPLNLRRVRLGDVVAAAIAQVRPLAAEKDVCLVAAVAPRLTLAADRLKLEQILINLLTNAIRHSPPGGTIHVEGAPTGSDLELRVRDHGDGIPRGDLERIFLPFQQVNRTAGAVRTGRLGAGLGLA